MNNLAQDLNIHTKAYDSHPCADMIRNSLYDICELYLKWQKLNYWWFYIKYKDLYELDVVERTIHNQFNIKRINADILEHLKQIILFICLHLQLYRVFIHIHLFAESDSDSDYFDDHYYTLKNLALIELLVVEYVNFYTLKT